MEKTERENHYTDILTDTLTDTLTDVCDARARKYRHFVDFKNAISFYLLNRSDFCNDELTEAVDYLINHFNIYLEIEIPY